MHKTVGIVLIKDLKKICLSVNCTLVRCSAVLCPIGLNENDEERYMSVFSPEY